MVSEALESEVVTMIAMAWGNCCDLGSFAGSFVGDPIEADLRAARNPGMAVAEGERGRMLKAKARMKGIGLRVR